MEKLNIKAAFNYPFNRAIGMFNIFWFFLPVIGWFALGGYGVRIVKEFIKGEFKELPIFNFGSDLKLGFTMFLKAIPFALVYIIIVTILGKIESWAGGLANFFIGVFVAPMLCINFFKKETVGSLFEFGILNSVFNNFGDYIVAMLKTILLQFVFILMIIILVGIPAGSFTKNIFIADFYRRKVK